MWEGDKEEIVVRRITHCLFVLLRIRADLSSPRL
jgi:hypothetical protein